MRSAGLHQITSMRRQRGVTLLETTLSVLAIGVLLALAFVGRPPTQTADVDLQSGVFLDKVVNSLYEFAARNNRLPCPDSNGDGLEDTACPASLKTGGVPYTSLGLSLATPVGSGEDQHLVYSVFRGGGSVLQDLTVSAERSVPQAHSTTHGSYQNRDDFLQALINARSQTSASLSVTEVHVTGNAGSSGAMNCSSNRIANMAFVVVHAGRTNADGLASVFDGENLKSWSGTGGWGAIQGQTCFVGPGASGPAYDDLVRAVSFLEMLGVLNQ